MKLLLVIFSFSISFSLYSCAQRNDSTLKKHMNPDAVRYNNTAMYLMARNSMNTDSLKKCIILIDSAILIEPDSWPLYHNKWIFLWDLGMFDSALKTSLHALTIDSVNYKLTWDAAMALDTLHSNDSAKLFYNKTLFLLDKMSKDIPHTALVNDYQKVIVNMLLNKDSGYIKKQIYDLKIKYKDSPFINSLISQLNSFNKQIYMMRQ